MTIIFTVKRAGSEQRLEFKTGTEAGDQLKLLSSDAQVHRLLIERDGSTTASLIRVGTRLEFQLPTSVAGQTIDEVAARRSGGAFSLAEQHAINDRFLRAVKSSQPQPQPFVFSQRRQPLSTSDLAELSSRLAATCNNIARELTIK